jgi:hypothetical protein
METPVKRVVVPWLILVLLFLRVPVCAASDAWVATPENQVFQFMQSGTCTAWSDGSSNQATAYLWIPERCQRLRGLLILCANVPEHRLVGHPAIRDVCAANDLGIVWSVPSFMNFRKDKAKGTDMAREHPTTVRFLQQLLDGLAKKSGYSEVATVPWLPMGESGHLLMVDALLEHAPERCIAGIFIKNNHLPPKNRTVPVLVAFGTAQEWAQDQTDIRTNWNNVRKAYDGILDQRRKNPNWPLSYLIDGHSGHFDCSEELTRYFARYIDLVAKARLPRGNSKALRPVVLSDGFLGDLAVPSRDRTEPVAFTNASAEARALPWFLDRDSALTAQRFAAINWQADTQMPAFVDAQGNVLPFEFNGIARLTPAMEPDGVTFTLRPMMLDALPMNFIGAGQKLSRAPGSPTVEWLCGPIMPLGGDRFRVSLDRSWPSAACYVAARQAGTDSIRAVVQPCAVKLVKNTAGNAQTLAFDLPAAVTNGTRAIRISATSDAGLPVQFFVRSGPAMIVGNELLFTPAPPRSRFPVTVKVTAWQWGRATEPAVQTAVLERELQIRATD